jgi:hypothetical protein
VPDWDTGGSFAPAKSAANKPSLSKSASVVGNFYSPFFNVSFYKPLGKGEKAKAKDLQVLGEGNERELSTYSKGFTLKSKTKGGTRLSYVPKDGADQLTNYRTNLTIEAPAAGAYRATLTLNPPYEDALKVLNNDTIQFNCLMVIRWGYSIPGPAKGNQRPPISDIGIFNIIQPTVRFGRSVQIQIVGFDILSSELQAKEDRWVVDRKVHSTDLDVVKVVAPSGLEVDDTNLRPEAKLLQDRSNSQLVQTQDDWTFFKDVMSMNDSTFIITENKIVLFEITDIDLSAPKYKLLWFQNPNPANDNEIPMISFDANSLISLFARRGARGYLDWSKNHDKNEVKKDKKKPGDKGGAGSKNTATTEEAFVQRTTEIDGRSVSVWTKSKKVKRRKEGEETEEKDDVTYGQVRLRPSRQALGEEQAEKKAADIRRTANTHADVVIPGHPGILPTHVVTVGGTESVRTKEGKKRNTLGPFGGNYRVMHVTHDLGQSGYTCRLKLFRASDKGDSEAPGPKGKGKPNTKALETSETPNPEVETG